MRIIIAPSDFDDSESGISPAKPRVLEIKARRLFPILAAAVLLLAAGVYGTARNIAEGWLRERAPVAQELAAEMDARRIAEDRQHRKIRQLALEDEIAALRAGIAELRGRGEALAGRMGLDGFVENAPPILECDSDAVPTNTADADSVNSAADSSPFNLVAYKDAFSYYRRRYDVMARHAADLGVTFDTVPLRRPVLGQNWLSSRFGMRRDPITGRRAFHSGYDYAARRGTPVLAGATGVITYVGRLGNYGNAIRIRHGGGVSTLYGHLRAMHVETGEYVRRGEVIGEIGSTGRSTGPHLHYEVRINDRPRPVAGAVKKLRIARAVPQEWEL